MAGSIIPLAPYQALRQVCRDVVQETLNEDMELAAYVLTMHEAAVEQDGDEAAILLTCALVLEDAIDTVVARGNVECLRETVEALRRGATRKVRRR